MLATAAAQTAANQRNTQAGRARPRPTALPSRLTEAEQNAHQALIGKMGDAAVWLKRV